MVEGIVGRQVWLANPNLVWASFDDSPHWVAFNADAGDSHLVTASARRLLELAGDGRAHTLDELVAQLSSETGLPLDDELRGTAGETLAFLDRAGLLRLART